MRRRSSLDSQANKDAIAKLSSSVSTSNLPGSVIIDNLRDEERSQNGNAYAADRYCHFPLVLPKPPSISQPRVRYSKELPDKKSSLSNAFQDIKRRSSGVQSTANTLTCDKKAICENAAIAIFALIGIASAIFMIWNKFSSDARTTTIEINESLTQNRIYEHKLSPRISYQMVIGDISGSTIQGQGEKKTYGKLRNQDTMLGGEMTLRLFCESHQKCMLDKCDVMFGRDQHACESANQSMKCSFSDSNEPRCLSSKLIHMDTKISLNSAIGTIEKEHICPTISKGSPEYIEKLSSKEKLVLTKLEEVKMQGFVFHKGVHLSDGATQYMIYNVDVLKCAHSCRDSFDRLHASGHEESVLVDNNKPISASTNRRLDHAMEAIQSRCLSFDFYPFDSPLDSFGEGCGKGICILHGENSLSKGVHLKRENEGFTDAEMIYSTHFSRPSLGGFFELRNLYDDNMSLMKRFFPWMDTHKMEIWGRSRTNAMRVSEDKDRNTNTDVNTLCKKYIENKSGDDYPSGHEYTSNYTVSFVPIGEYGECPGLSSRQGAEILCREASGRLCTEKEFLKIKNHPLGCGYEGYDTWTLDMKSNQNENDANSEMPLYPRCCADVRSYAPPHKNLCQPYHDKEVISHCSRLETQEQCTKFGSGSVNHFIYGEGGLLNHIRDNCKTGEGPCEGPIQVQPHFSHWHIRDTCTWCEQSRKCLPGGHPGICKSNNASHFDFIELIKHECGMETSCKINEILGE